MCIMFTRATTVDDINPALPPGPQTMGIMVHALFWVMQDSYHQPQGLRFRVFRVQSRGCPTLKVDPNS